MKKGWLGWISVWWVSVINRIKCRYEYVMLKIRPMGYYHFWFTCFLHVNSSLCFQIFRIPPPRFLRYWRGINPSIWVTRSQMYDQQFTKNLSYFEKNTTFDVLVRQECSFFQNQVCSDHQGYYDRAHHNHRDIKVSTVAYLSNLG